MTTERMATTDQRHEVAKQRGTSGSARDDTAEERDGAAAQLTKRQKETLVLLGEGLGTSEIAARLNVSDNTARNHIRGMMGALEAHTRLEAVAIANRIGLLPPR